jgi:hypothetical protein
MISGMISFEMLESRRVKEFTPRFSVTSLRGRFNRSKMKRHILSTISPKKLGGKGRSRFPI